MSLGTARSQAARDAANSLWYASVFRSTHNEEDI